MAVLARQVLEDAARAADTAEALTILMEPHLQKRYGDSAIYAYTNERSVPPGDVLLAAALATGISLDEKLGIVRQETEVQRQVEELRTQVARMCDEMVDLRRELVGAENAWTPSEEALAPGTGVAARARAERAVKRREWARRSAAAPPAAQPASGGRPAGRDRRL